MIMKMRTLFFSKTGNAQIISEKIARENKCTSDQIPPAYPCENEKVLFVCLEIGNTAPKQVVDFLKNLNPQRSKNVAFCLLTKTGSRGIADLKELLAPTGVNAVENVFERQLKGGLFRKASITEQDLLDAQKWANDVIESLKH